MKNRLLILLLTTFYSIGNAQDTLTFDFETKKFKSSFDYPSSVTYQVAELKVEFKNYKDDFKSDKIKLINRPNKLILSKEFQVVYSSGITINSDGSISIAGITDKISLPFEIEITIAGESEPIKLSIGDKTPFFDAIAFNKTVNKTDKKESLRILKKYDNSITEDISLSVAKSKFASNIFLRNQIDETKERKDEEIKNAELKNISQAFNTTEFSSNTIKSIGTFIADRFKQELNIAFLEKFREMLKKYEELEALFPKSLEILQNNEPYNFTTFLQTLKDAFQEDLDNLTDNLRSYLQKKYNDNPIDVLAYLLTINEIVDGLINDNEKKLKPYQIIEKIYDSGYLNELKSNEGEIISNSFKLLAIISRNIMNQSGSDWLYTDDLKLLIKPTKEASNFRELFIGFLCEKEKGILTGIKFDKVNDLYTLIMNPKVIKFNDFVYQITSKIIDLQRIQKQKYFKEGGKEEDKFLKFYKYSKGLTSLISSALEGVLDLGVISNTDAIFDKIKNKYIPTTSSTLDLINYIKNKEYGLAINSAYEIVKLYLEDTEKNTKDDTALTTAENDLKTAENDLKTARNTFKAETGNQKKKEVYEDAKRKCEDMKRKCEDAKKEKSKELIVPSYILKYGNFIASMAVAKDADEMLKILETAALPVGSYRIKRNALFDISLNAYAGGFVGVEWFQGDKTMLEAKGVDKTKFALGFTAPVGINFSWNGKKDITQDDIDGKTKFSKNFKFIDKNGNPKVLRGTSHSLFLSIIDVGAVTSFKLTSDSTKTLPDFTWENVLAPGVFYVHGFRNSPLSLNIGFQYGPQIRSLKNDQTTIDNDALRSFSIRAGLTVDIPIFSFFTRNEKRVKNK